MTAFAVAVSQLDDHPLFRKLAADLRARPGRTESDDGDPARAAVAIILRATHGRHTTLLPDVVPTEHGTVTGHGASTGKQDSSRVASIGPGLPTLELLLIQRAERDGDPWSGQIALPGGRRHPEDATLQDTAVRETREETGIDLATHGLVLGTLDELRPRTPVLPPIIVTPFVAIAPPDLPTTISDELADAFWVPWTTFADPARIDESPVEVRGASWRVPSYQIGERVVWGMTERMLRQLAQRISTLATD